MKKPSSTAPRIQLNSLVKPEIRDQVAAIASKDNRSLSAMVEILLIEAIEHRQIETRKSA